MCLHCYFANDLSAYLADILFSTHFMSTISHQKVHDTEIMISFDANSLFTNVPIDGAVQATLQKLENDLGLADQTLTPAQIADLLNFILRYMYFQYDGRFTNKRMEQP